MKKLLLSSLLILFSCSASIHADTLFTIPLTGAEEVPPHDVTGTGVGTVLLNTAQDQITVNASWTGLTGPAAAGHIHGPAPAGSTASVLFPLADVPAAISGSIPEQTFAIDATQLGWLLSGLLYLNIHTPEFPDGEIRGQIAPVPEPASVALLVFALLLLLPFGYRRFSTR